MYGFVLFSAAFLAVLCIIFHDSIESNNVFISWQHQLAIPDSYTPRARVLFLTAHPDDECMFFAPTIMALTSKVKFRRSPARHSVEYWNNNNAYPEVFSLCLSAGDADGLGTVRREELGRSLDVLGIGDEKRSVVDHPDLKDNITSYWRPELIADVLSPYILKHGITTILTFDHQGISGHPNHRSLPEGVLHVLRNYNYASEHPPPKLFSLITHPIRTKYTAIAGPLFARVVFYKARRQSHSNKVAFEGSTPIFISGISDYLTALRAMWQHWSQLVWFRWFYVFFSRYMWVNEWAEITVEERVNRGL
ncbi:LmbE-like protein [Tricholoma matsutake]|nr:LmbE-like protein [Tricholoma matsutake 945]